MKGLYKFGLIIGACASVASLVLLITIANHIARSIQEDELVDEAEEHVRRAEESGLKDVENTQFPQE